MTNNKSEFNILFSNTVRFSYNSDTGYELEDSSSVVMQHFVVDALVKLHVQTVENKNEVRTSWQYSKSDLYYCRGRIAVGMKMMNDRCQCKESRRMNYNKENKCIESYESIVRGSYGGRILSCYDDQVKVYENRHTLGCRTTLSLTVRKLDYTCVS